MWEQNLFLPWKRQENSHPSLEVVREQEVQGSYSKQGSYDIVIYCTQCGQEQERVTVYTPYLTLDIPQGVKTSNTSAGCKLTWKRVTGAQKYQIYRNGKLAATTTVLSWTDTEAKNGKVYTYTIKAKAGDNLSNASAKSTICRLTAVKIKSAKKTAAAKAKVKWSKNAAASDYQIKYISGGKTKTYVRVYKKVKL